MTIFNYNIRHTTQSGGLTSTLSPLRTAFSINANTGSVKAVDDEIRFTHQNTA